MTHKKVPCCPITCIIHRDTMKMLLRSLKRIKCNRSVFNMNKARCPQWILFQLSCLSSGTISQYGDYRTVTTMGTRRFDCFDHTFSHQKQRYKSSNPKLSLWQRSFVHLVLFLSLFNSNWRISCYLIGCHRSLHHLATSCSSCSTLALQRSRSCPGPVRSEHSLCSHNHPSFVRRHGRWGAWRAIQHLRLRFYYMSTIGYSS